MRAIKSVLKKIISVSVCFIQKGIRLLAWWFSILLPVKKNKIIVSSYYGRGYGDNPKYIVEQLLLSNKKLKIIWLLKNMDEAKSLPQGVTPCKNNTIRGIYHLATSKIWIDNCRKSFRYKKKNQIYIQTWHGFALKRIEKDVQDHLGKSYVQGAIKDSRNVDLIISDSRFMTQIYNSSFWYEGEVVEWGSPRNDIFWGDCSEYVSKIKNYYGIGIDKKIILYAPTFRCDHSLDAYNLDCRQVCSLFQQRFGDEFVLLIRLHPNIVDKCSNIKFDNNQIINATFYPDMQELLAGVDVVISDYSSLMFDFALSRKPCFQFATDIEQYKMDRNFYFEIDNLPFPLCRSNSELKDVILSFDIDSYRKGIDAFFVKVGMIEEGNASKNCAKWIIERID